MIKNKQKTIGFPCRPSSKGGPGQFQQRFEAKMIEKGWNVVYPDSNIIPDVILVNGNTRHIWWLLKTKFKGTKILYRLGGINWLYKKNPGICLIKKILISFKFTLIPLVQRLLADAIIYQSEFSKEWLLKLGQSARIKNNYVIYNGVDIDIFKPISVINGEKEKISLICVEGNLDYSPYAVDLLNFLQCQLVDKGILHEIRLYGDFERRSSRQKLNPSIQYLGLISKDEIHKVYRDGIYLSLDVNPGCPNALMEALASGVPVVGFNTGSLTELVHEGSGIIVPYGGNPWVLDFPDAFALIEPISRIVADYETFSRNAHRIAKERYSIEDMVGKYIKVISQTVDLNEEN